MHILMLDTCVWLEVASKKNEMRTLAAIEYLVEQGVIAVLLPALVQEEFERNKDRVADQTRKRLSQECKLVKEVLASFGGEGMVCPGTGGQVVKSYCSHFAAQIPSD